MIDKITIELGYEDLEILHSAWEKVRSLNELYPDLLMTGRQTDRLRPFNVREFGELTQLRDRVGQRFQEVNTGETSLPTNWEITDQMGVSHRRASPPV